MKGLIIMKYYYEFLQMEDFPGEKWRVIKDAPLYLVSNLGRVKSKTYEKWYGKGKKQRLVFYKSHIKKQTPNVNGYLVVNLINKYGKKQVFRVNRLVAIAFLPNPHNLPQVNHLNEDIKDNRLVNLVWSTAKDNVNHGLHNARVSKSMGWRVRCDGHEFTSITKAAKFYGHNPKVFWEWLTGKKPMPQEWKDRGLQLIQCQGGK